LLRRLVAGAHGRRRCTLDAKVDAVSVGGLPTHGTERSQPAVQTPNPKLPGRKHNNPLLRDTEMSELTCGQKREVWQWSTRRAPGGYCRRVFAAADAQQLAEVKHVAESFATQWWRPMTGPISE